ncbi:T9SS type A sorting domain-containing protein [Algoriphagus aestuarii]|nr:T9SS type A sorting domain-containing protein [Algoriphagus aestuarii]
MQSWGLDLESVTWINPTTGIAAGENLIIRTADGGLTWEETQIPEIQRIYDLIFINESTGIAVGENGMILKSQDSGLTWNKTNSPTEKALKSISKANDNRIFAAGESGLLLFSDNQGTSWQAISSPTSSNLNEIFFVDDQLGFAVGDNGTFLKTENGGSSFTKITMPFSSTINSVSFFNESEGYLVGADGKIYKTIDGGENWSALNSGVTVDLLKIVIHSVDKRIVLAAGEQGTLLKSTNSGATFSKINLGATNTRKINSLEFLPESNLAFAVGQDGYLISSANSGTSWSIRLAGYRTHFNSIDFKSDRTGFIAGDNGQFFVTSNAATSIISRPLPEPLDVISIDFWNTGFGYASGESGKMYRTGNGGSTWVPVPAATVESINGFYLFAPSVLYVTGTNGYIARSFDSGGTWDSNIATNTSENMKDVTYFDYQVGFAIGDNGQISWTNGGNTWENLPKLTDQDLNALAKLDSNTSVIVGDGGVILKSEDMAKTWRAISSGITENLNSVDFWDENIGMIVGDNGLTLQTKDGGENWLQIESGTIRDLNAVSMGTSLVAFTAGEDGTILTYTCVPPPGISAISGGSEICLGTALYQVEDTILPGSQIVWRVDGGEIISGQGTSKVQVNWTTAGRQGVFVSRQNFCGNGETSALEVLVVSKPKSSLEIIGNGSVCTNQAEIYSLENMDGINYLWTVQGGELLAGENTHEVQIQWNETGAKQVSVVLENNCGKSDPITKEVVVSAAPEQPSEIKGDSQVGLGEYSYEVEAIDGIDYQWGISGNSGRIISGQGTHKITIEWLLEGDFTLKVTPQNSCNDGESRELTININIITGIEPEADLSLKIFPNPSQGSLTISSEYLSKFQEFTVVNSLGQKLMQSEISPGQTEIYLTELPKGLLLIRLKSNRQTIVRKLVVN